MSVPDATSLSTVSMADFLLASANGELIVIHLPCDNHHTDNVLLWHSSMPFETHALLIYSMRVPTHPAVRDIARRGKATYIAGHLPLQYHRLFQEFDQLPIQDCSKPELTIRLFVPWHDYPCGARRRRIFYWSPQIKNSIC